MNDPRRLKTKAELYVEATYKEEAAPLRLYAYADPDRIRAIPREVLEKKLADDLGRIAIQPVSTITKTYLAFHYAERDALSDFDYANTLIEVTLPYCLHFPNYHEIEMREEEHDLRARITFMKVWTALAEADGEKSDLVDLFAEDRITYFKDSVILSPRMPVVPEEGWQQKFTGRNIERVKDQHGTFRYTRLLIETDTSISKDDLSGQAVERPITHVRDKALIIVNRLIDAYRSVTRESVVRRLGTLNVNMIYFITHDQGFYLMSMGFGIETAKINRSSKEIDKVGEVLLSGKRPDLYELLLLDARDSLDNRDHQLAILEAFQAVEIFLETDLIKRFEARGTPGHEYQATLKKKWHTKARLTSVLKDVTGKSIVLENRDLWDRWCTSYDKVRNPVIHTGYEPSTDEVKRAIDTNEKLIEWIRSLN